MKQMVKRLKNGLTRLIQNAVDIFMYHDEILCGDKDNMQRRNNVSAKAVIVFRNHYELAA